MAKMKAASIALLALLAGLMLCNCSSLRNVKLGSYEDYDKSKQENREFCGIGQSRELCVEQRVCLSRRYVCERATVYATHVQHVEGAREALDSALILVASATAASFAYKASTESILGLAIGGATIGGFRSYFTDNPTSAAYVSAISALNCLASAATDLPAEADLKNCGGLDEVLARAKSFDKTTIRDSTVRLGLEAAITAAEGARQLLSKASTAYNSFAARMFDLSMDIELKTFVKVRGLRPDVNAITASIQKVTRESIEAQAKQDEINRALNKANNSIPDSKVDAARKPNRQSQDEKAAVLKGKLADYVEKVNKFAEPMLEKLKAAEECALKI